MNGKTLKEPTYRLSIALYYGRDIGDVIRKELFFETKKRASEKARTIIRAFPTAEIRLLEITEKTVEKWGIKKQ